MGTTVGTIGLNMVLNSAGFKRSLQNVQSQANTASNKMAASFKKIGAAIAATFSAAMIKKLGQECITLANVQTEAETKLTTVMKQRMKATDEGIQKVKDYASAQQELGVVGDEVQLSGAQQLSTFLQTEDALKTLIPAMNNLAVQQNGVNIGTSDMVNIGNLMGKVMQGQTSALTRVGITFTEAQEQVLKYGNEQERAAMLAQVITDNVGEMNKAIANTPAGQIQKIKNSFGDMQETLGRGLQNVFAPFLKYLNSAVSKLSELALKFEEFTQKIFGNANSTSVATSGAASDTVDSISSLTNEADSSSSALDSVADSAEKAKRSVAGFDKLNVLSQPDKTETSSTAPTNSTPPTSSADSSVATSVVKSTNNGLSNAFNGLYEKSGFKTFVDKIQRGIEKVNWSAIGDNCKSIFNNALPIVQSYLKGIQKVGVSAFGTIGSIIGGIVQVGGKQLQTLTGGVAKWLEKDGGKITAFINDYYTNISNGLNNLSTFFDGIFDLMGDSVDRMRPTMENAISDLLSGFTNFGISIGTIISEGFEIATGSLVEWIEKDGAEIGLFFDNIQLQIADVMSFIGGIFSDIGTILSDWWNSDSGSSIFKNICDMFTNIGTTLMNVYNDWIMPAWNFIVGVFQSAWDNCLKPIFDNLVSFFGKLCDCISTVWNNFLSPLVNWIVDVLGPVFTNVFNAVKGVFDTVFTVIGDVVSGILKTFGGLLDFITGIFSGNWEKAWQGISDFFGGIWDGIWGIVKGAVNLIIDGINLLWTGIYTVLQGIVDGIGGIAGAIGDVFGQDWHFSMPKEVPLIPKLAKGGIVKAPTLAVVGDNAGANTGNPEVISPLNKLQTMINTSNGQDVVILSQILDYLKRIYEMFVVFRNNGGNMYEFVAKLNGSTLFDEMVNQNELYKKRHNGKSAFL